MTQGAFFCSIFFQFFRERAEEGLAAGKEGNADERRFFYRRKRRERRRCRPSPCPLPKGEGFSLLFTDGSNPWATPKRRFRAAKCRCPNGPDGTEEILGTRVRAARANTERRS